LRENGLKGICTCASNDIDECTGVKDNVREICKDWRSLATTIDVWIMFGTFWTWGRVIRKDWRGCSTLNCSQIAPRPAWPWKGCYDGDKAYGNDVCKHHDSCHYPQRKQSREENGDARKEVGVEIAEGRCQSVAQIQYSAFCQRQHMLEFGRVQKKKIKRAQSESCS